ncbi:MAG: adenylosuccinate synthase [Planctomycetes bacterium]|nr:adenylosuccinate synthase [Planctomycetota bacterium]
MNVRNTPNVTVIGLQWGDEGKGKVVDALSEVCRYVVRFCGGANAGHTVNVAGQRYALHLVPCGILREGVLNVVGNGVAFDPAVALEEMDQLRRRGVKVQPENLAISSAAQVVMPWHKLEDRLSESRLGDGKIGTTAKGIGPCYADKARRTTAVRVADLLDGEKLREKILRIAELKSRTFEALYSAKPLDGEAVAAEYAEFGRRLGPFVANTGAILRRAVAAGEAVLFEGGQGSMLDVDHGTYPFVTSSSVTACGVPAGTGVPPGAVGQVVGLVKAYTSRVGAGPFPTELDNEVGQRLRERGHEYGTTTGRPRRCGWFDAFAVRYAADLSGADELALALLDVLSGFDEVKICTGYRDPSGRAVEDFDPAAMAGVECIYETLPGWKEDIHDARRFEELPAAARQYVERIEQLVGRPVGFIGVGPDRRQTIIHNTQVRGLER